MMSDQEPQLESSLYFMRKHLLWLAKACTARNKEGDCLFKPWPGSSHCRRCMSSRKKCQWSCPDEIGESKMVCLMGFPTLRWHLKNVWEPTSWIWMGSDVLLANIFTPGVATSLLSGRHVKRTWYSYQVTLAWVHILKVQEYHEFCQSGYSPHETWLKDLQPPGTGE